MDFKVMTSHSESMILDWLKHIQQVHSEYEAIIKNGSQFFVPFVAISTPIVETVFIIVKNFNLSSKTKYLALSIYDKFMCSEFWNLFMQYGNDPDSSEYKAESERISNRSRLSLMSCIQLASKMDCHSNSLGIPQVIYGLKLMDSLANEKNDYTPSEIFNSEFRIFQMIGFKIPIITPVDAIEILLAALNLHDMPKLYEATMNILDFTYLQHQQLYCQLQFMVTGTLAKTKAQKINLMAMESDILFLSSGIILCALFIFNMEDSLLDSVKNQLSELVKIDDSDIYNMARVIVTMIDLPN